MWWGQAQDRGFTSLFTFRWMGTSRITTRGVAHVERAGGGSWSIKKVQAVQSIELVIHIHTTYQCSYEAQGVNEGELYSRSTYRLFIPHYAYQHLHISPRRAQPNPTQSTHVVYSTQPNPYPHGPHLVDPVQTVHCDKSTSRSE